MTIADLFLSTQTRYVLRQICTTPLPARDKDVMKTWAQDIQMMHEILFYFRCATDTKVVRYMKIYGNQMGI